MRGRNKARSFFAFISDLSRITISLFYKVDIL